MAPMWSSWAWVITTASMRWKRPSRLEKSGRIRSTPGWSGSGNSTPQSTTSSRPAYSNTVMFRPISPRPPSPTMRSPRLGRAGGAVRPGCGWLTRQPRWPRRRRVFAAGEAGASCRSSGQLHAAGHQIGAQPVHLLRGRVDERPADRAAGQAEQAQRGLGGDRALRPGHDADVDRQQLAVDLQRLTDPAGQVRVDHLVQPVADDVADDADEAARPDRQPGQVEHVVA